MFALSLVMVLGILLQEEKPTVIELGLIQRVLVVNHGILTGPTPENDLPALSRHGIKTIISVDAARPDVQAAEKLGMRYVHLPLSYDGIDATSQRRLARAIRDLPGPVYVHCHRGRHRGPAAVAVSMVVLNRAKSAKAMEILRVAGTSRSYPGLYEAVLRARPLEKAVIDAVPMHELPQIAPMGNLDSIMARTDRVFLDLEAIDQGKWQFPCGDCAEKTGLLTELLRESFDAIEAKKMKAGFSSIIVKSTALEKAIDAQLFEQASLLFSEIRSDCRACHQTHRARQGPLSQGAISP